MHMSHFAVALLVLCTTIACANARKSVDPNSTIPDPQTERTLAQGKLTGFTEGNGAHVWRNVPYAASTAGLNRWRAPLAPEPWNGTRDATKHGDRCAQISNAFNQSEGIEPGLLLGSEDCLITDIYAPPNAAGKNLPVMMWIHGGSNVSGAAHLYNGARLSRNENVIVVIVQYRLGPLGWFSHELLENEGDGANFGTLDLIAALEWIRDNISAFNGNPSNVTIFGESAGGHNVATLLASPLAKGLFHRAIIQSGSFDSVSIAQARGTQGNEPNPSNEIVAKLNASNTDELRALPVRTLLDAYLDGSGYVNLPRIIEDGIVLPDQPLRQAFNDKATFNAVPIITGTNRDEMKLFQALDPALTRRVLGQFLVPRNQKLYDAGSDYSSRVWRIRAVDLPAQAMNDAGHTSVYGYRFDWDDGGSFLFTDLSRVLGASHGMEIPFVFNHYALLGQADGLMFQKKTQESRDILSLAMGRYWANFARTGVPSAEDHPAWAPYAADATLLRLDAIRNTKLDRGIEIIQGADSLDAVIADLKADRRVNANERCLIAKGISAWVPSLTDQIEPPFCDSAQD